MEKNLTKGSVFKTLVAFSLPFLLSNILQTLYGLADLYIIGLFCKTESTTAVSIGSQLMHMLTVMIVGLAMGGTVLIGKAVGAEDRKLRNKAIGNTIAIFLIVSVGLTAVLVLCRGLIVDAMSTPVEAVSETLEYVLICFFGIPFVTAYNVLSSVFRGMGDSKSPMYFVAVACVFNVGLDFLFIGAFGMGAAGAALGTILAQAVSVAVAITAIRRKKMIEGLTGRDLKPDKAVYSEIFKVGIPISVQDGFIQISFLLITIFANSRGLQDSAAVGIVEKLIGILFLIPSSLLASVSALCAQNIGAKELGRANRTLFDAAAIAVAFGLFFSILFQYIAPWAVGRFTDDQMVIKLGDQYMRSYVWDCIVAGVHFVFSGYFCAIGKSGISFMHNIISILTARIPIAYYASVHYESLYPMGLAAPIGSAISAIICAVAFIVLNKKIKNDTL